LTIPHIVDLIVGTNVFNCIRLTYSVEMWIQDNTVTGRQSLKGLNLSSQISAIDRVNPGLLDLPVLNVFDSVVSSCNAANISVLFDNQVSKAMWCCSYTDGNGWWNDKYFDPNQWLLSLLTISSRYNDDVYPNAVAFSLRNELRTDTHSHADQLSDWYNYVPQGIEALHKGKPSALKFISGLNYDCDLSFLNEPSPNKTEWMRVLQQYKTELVFEAHIYSWSGFGNATEDCSEIGPAYDKAIGWPLQNDRPLVLTETGLTQINYPNNRVEYLYWHCVAAWITQYKLGFGIWLFAGSYILRDGRPNEADTFGTVSPDFSHYAGQAFLAELQTLIFYNQSQTLRHTETQR